MPKNAILRLPLTLLVKGPFCSLSPFKDLLFNKMRIRTQYYQNIFNRDVFKLLLKYIHAAINMAFFMP